MHLFDLMHLFVLMHQFVMMHPGTRAERVGGQLNGHARAICFLAAHCSKPTAV